MNKFAGLAPLAKPKDRFLRVASAHLFYYACWNFDFIFEEKRKFHKSPPKGVPLPGQLSRGMVRLMLARKLPLSSLFLLPNKSTGSTALYSEHPQMLGW